MLVPDITIPFTFQKKLNKADWHVCLSCGFLLAFLCGKEYPFVSKKEPIRWWVSASFQKTGGSIVHLPNCTV